MIRLSVRLQAIYDFIDEDVIADIGCDHGYIPLRFFQERRGKAYACDVAQKPLERARKLFAKEGAPIDCLLMDGIEDLPEDVKQIVIAGMGGSLMIDILKKDMKIAKRCESMILSPHKDASALRDFLIGNGFRIEKEKVVYEAGHYYPILYVTGGKQARSEACSYYGYNVIEDSTYEKYLMAELEKWTALENKIPEKDFDEGKRRLGSLKSVMKLQK